MFITFVPCSLIKTFHTIGCFFVIQRFNYTVFMCTSISQTSAYTRAVVHVNGYMQRLLCFHNSVCTCVGWGGGWACVHAYACVCTTYVCDCELTALCRLPFFTSYGPTMFTCTPTQQSCFVSVFYLLSHRVFMGE